jgi:hypothetical protein
MIVPRERAKNGGQALPRNHASKSRTGDCLTRISSVTPPCALRLANGHPSIPNRPPALSATCDSSEPGASTTLITFSALSRLSK